MQDERNRGFERWRGIGATQAGRVFPNSRSHVVQAQAFRGSAKRRTHRRAIVAIRAVSCRTVTYLLVTNDDGIDSPALRPLLDSLRGLGNLRAVVPDRERSWIGKAITRWDKLQVRRVEEPREGEPELFTVDAFPADCAHLGIHSLFPERPNLLISGINVGLNYGSGFFFSSGTVGAAIEGWIAGVPSVAFSLGQPDDDRSWKSQSDSAAFRPQWERAAARCADIVRSLLEDGYPCDCELLSVNLPLGSGPETPCEVTQLAHASYTQLFREEAPGRFAHDFRGEVLHRSALEGSDVRAVAEGRISITPIRLSQDPELARGLRARFSKL